MQIRIISISEKTRWNDFLIKNHGPFTQSWEWGEILLKEGKKVERLGLFDGEELVGVAHIVYSKFLGFSYAFAPKGPVLAGNFERASELLVKYLKTQRCVFFRIEPSFLIEKRSDTATTIDINPRATSILNLENSLENILANMHEKTRYNIKLSERKNLLLLQDKNLTALMDLLELTGKRDNFRLHDKKHYKEILDSPLASQFSAVLDGRTVATIVKVDFGETSTYLFGASDYNFRHVMAPHFLQWQVIKDSKSKGYIKYDFFGIAPKSGDGGECQYDKKHQYAGVTRFKLGFGGEIVENIGTVDLVISPAKYKAYQFLRKIRRAL